MQKILFICLIGIIILFQMQLRYGRGGYAADDKVKQQIAKARAANATLKDRNALLLLKISGLKGSDDSLEARSRHELNLIKPGETLVLLPGNEISLSKNVH